MNELHSHSVSISSLNSVPRRKSETDFVFFRKSTFFFLLYPYHSPQNHIFMTTFEKDGEENERKFQWPVPGPDGRHTAGGQAVPPQQQSAGRLRQQVPLQAGLAIKKPTQKKHLKKPLKCFFGFFLIFNFLWKYLIQTFLFETYFYEQIRHKLSFIYKKW